MTSAAKDASGSREKVIRAFLTQGSLGLVLMIGAAILQRDETSAILRDLGGATLPLVAIFFLTSAALQSLRFELTPEISVSLELTAFMTMYPLLGMVISAWVAVAATIIARVAAALWKREGAEEADREVERSRAFGLFGTFGIPVLAASWLFTRMGGTVPLRSAGRSEIVAMAVCSVAMIAVNNLVMMRAVRAYGYPFRRILALNLADGSIYLLTLPLTICTVLVYDSMGWVAVFALCGELVLAYGVARKMAQAKAASKRLLQRLESLTRIGEMISLTTSDDLLTTIYTECGKVIDASIFSIALVDEQSSDLILEFAVADGHILPKQRIPRGQGLNSWVVENHRPLLLGRMEDEREIGIQSFDDGLRTEAWLGVPMIARDRVIGAISVQSYRRNAFSDDDVLLLTTVANQAAVAIDNAHLYEDLENLTYQLEERVQTRTNELRETHVRLIAADGSKNEFLAKMSHELRTPLNSIIGFSSILLRDSRAYFTPRLYKFLENIHAAGTHLLGLINDILDLSKIEAGKMELRLDTFDLRETVASVERVMKGFAAEAKVSIMSLVDPGTPSVRLDEGRLKQILFNLLSNAVKFSNEGGIVRMTVAPVSAPSSPLRVDSIRIDVTDEGIGIPEDDLALIFEEFYQGTADANGKRGTGLGLSLTRNFVELHHGTIDVQSHPGEGSTFTLFLPVDGEKGASVLPVLGRARERSRTSAEC